jgi:cyclophilin family peptidyl-prolyl cis-trans isomerase
MIPRLPAAFAVAATLALACLAGCDRAPQPTPPAAAPSPAPTPEPTPPPAPTARADYGPLHAVFEVPWGSFRVKLATKECPRVCASFVNLVERGFYDDQLWGDFSPVVRQTGETSGRFDPGYSIPREFSPRLLFDRGGLLCASNTTDDATARVRPGRIFVTVKAQERWNLVYCVFGEVVEGMDVVNRLTDGERLVRVRVEGDTAPMRAAYAAELKDWNAKLDAMLPRRGAAK